MIRRFGFRTALVGFLVTGAGVVAGCGPQPAPAAAPPEPTPSASPVSCDRASLPTRTIGRLTVATPGPAAPWFIGDRPEDGRGYEAALAYAVAKRMGFGTVEVAWTRVPASEVLAGNTSSFDIALGRMTITDERRSRVDFSSPYYDVRQAVVAVETSRARKAATMWELANVKLGAEAGTVSHTAMSVVVEPEVPPQSFVSIEAAKQALVKGTIDGIVVDLPTAFRVRSELPGAVIIGQIPLGDTTPEQFGLVLEHGSPLTLCVSQAVDSLHADGTLRRLEQSWLARAGAPELS